MFKQTLRQHLEKVFPDQELNQWFDPLAVNMGEDGKSLRIIFPHNYFGSWFTKTIKNKFEHHAQDCLQGLTITYDDHPPHSSLRHDPGHDFLHSLPTVLPLTHGHEYVHDDRSQEGCEVPEASSDGSFFPESSFSGFSGFLSNRKNEFPVAAAKEAVEKVSHPLYTPIVFYGHSGCGKSHLLRAMAESLRERDIAIFHGGLEFFEAFHMTPGRAGVLPVQAVLIDDTQRIVVYPEWQDDMATLIDTCKANSKLLVLLWDNHPDSCLDINQKLRARLTSSLVVELKRPDLDVRRRYVQLKGEQLGLDLQKHHVLAMASRYQDIRAIDGALTRITAFRSLVGYSDTIQADAISDPDFSLVLGRDTGLNALTPAGIVAIISAHFSIDPMEITGKSRDRQTALARHVAILLCRELTELSLIRIGRFFSDRDHSSVLYSIKKIKKLQASNKVVNKQVEELRRLCLARPRS